MRPTTSQAVRQFISAPTNGKDILDALTFLRQEDPEALADMYKRLLNWNAPNSDMQMLRMLALSTLPLQKELLDCEESLMHCMYSHADIDTTA